jgi:S-adenosylmethionine hydrolase
MTSSRPIVTLTTDFGMGSPYVAQVKGVILTRNPDVCLVDVSHSIPPQDIRGGALALSDACFFFPPQSLHLAVIDPGVGTDRRIVYAEIGDQRFLAPDNGVLTLVAQRATPALLIEVTDASWFLPTVHPTFHGRDIFAPVAGQLSLGIDPRQLGRPMTSLVQLPLPRPVVEDRHIAGQIIHVDSFGNLITNITQVELTGVTAPAAATVVCRAAIISRIRTTYGHAPAGSLIALVGSNGRLEIAVVNGNASVALAAGLDDPVDVTW